MARKRQEIPWLKIHNGIYYVHWFADSHTQRLSLRTSDSVEAQKRYAEFLAAGHEIFAPAKGLTVIQALDDYYREHVRQNCVAPGRQELAIRHLKDWFGTTLLAEVDIPQSRAYADARRKAGVVDSTIRRELAALVAASRHAKKWKRLSPQEASVVELPRVVAAEARHLTEAQIDRLIKTAEGPLRDFIVIAYYTAGRRGSIERLTKFQVDLKMGRINLRSPNETVAQRLSKKRRPVVPIDPALRPTIERLMAQPTERLLPPLQYYRLFLRLMTQLGFDGSPHTLRHSRATHLLQRGVGIYDVARLLGDAVDTVESVYGHHSSEYLAETIGGKT